MGQTQRSKNGDTVAIPLLRPNPPRLSLLHDELVALENSGVFTNNGQHVRRFEAASVETVFGGVGACVTVSNATIGLVLALRQAAEASGRVDGLALMPSFTFAATAHAALWAGLTPVLCDIDPHTWVPCAGSEEKLLEQYGDRVAAIVPYASFGNGLDLKRYHALSARYGAGVVVDAASSLGSVDLDGRGFGAGSPMVFVYSMHATKAFAVGEGGLIYSQNDKAIRALRQMASFGFGDARSAIMPGLNGKMGEIAALMALTKLRDMDRVVTYRNVLAACYRDQLQGFQFQTSTVRQQALQFMPVLLPAGRGGERAGIMKSLAQSGIGTGAYFSPHLAQQPFFRTRCIHGSMPVTEDIASRVLALPLSDMMTPIEVTKVCHFLRAACSEGRAVGAPRHTTPPAVLRPHALSQSAP